MRRTDRACTQSHLQAALNSIDVGLLSFDHTLSILLGNDCLGTILGITPAVLGRCTTIDEVLKAGTTFTDVLVRQIHQSCLAAVSSTEPLSNLTFSFIFGLRVFTLQISQIGGA